MIVFKCDILILLHTSFADLFHLEWFLYQLILKFIFDCIKTMKGVIFCPRPSIWPMIHTPRGQNYGFIRKSNLETMGLHIVIIILSHLFPELYQ